MEFCFSHLSKASRTFSPSSLTITLFITLNVYLFSLPLHPSIRCLSPTLSLRLLFHPSLTLIPLSPPSFSTSSKLCLSVSDFNHPPLLSSPLLLSLLSSPLLCSRPVSTRLYPVCLLSDVLLSSLLPLLSSFCLLFPVSSPLFLLLVFTSFSPHFSPSHLSLVVLLCHLLLFFLSPLFPFLLPSSLLICPPLHLLLRFPPFLSSP